MPDISSMKADTPELNQTWLLKNIMWREMKLVRKHVTSHRKIYIIQKNEPHLECVGKGGGLNLEIGEAEVGTSIGIQSGCDIFQGESKEIQEQSDTNRYSLRLLTCRRPWRQNSPYRTYFSRTHSTPNHWAKSQDCWFYLRYTFLSFQDLLHVAWLPALSQKRS